MTQIQLKPQHHHILILLFRFRFLTRIQLQSLLHHKHHSRIQLWLNDLTTHNYLIRYFDKLLTSQPAVYSIAPLGRTYLKHHLEQLKVQSTVLNRVWREHAYTQEFKNKYLFLADLYISLTDFTEQTQGKLHFSTKAELHCMSGLISPPPDAYCAFEQPGKEIFRYFLEVWTEVPAKALRVRANRYLEYFESQQWQEATDKPFPEIIFVLPNTRLKSHLRLFLKNRLSEESDLIIHLMTWEEAKAQGLGEVISESVRTESARF